MTLVRTYEPWNVLNSIQRGLALHAAKLNNRDQNDTTTTANEWRPAVDIKEEDDKFIIHADLPGIAPEDIEVTTEQNVLILKGERAVQQQQSKEENYQYTERAYGAFCRRFNLPETVDSDRIEAKMQHGVLQITLLKCEHVQARKIAIKS